MRAEDAIRARRNEYWQRMVECTREALAAVPGSIAQERAFREGRLFASLQLALSWILDDLPDIPPDMLNVPPDVLSDVVP